MGDAEQRGIQLMAEAEKKLTSSKGFFGQLFGGPNKVDEAVDLYLQAGNKFKIAKKWSSAGKAFTDLAKLHQKSGNRLDTATNYIEAANCYRKADPNEAVNSLLKGIEIYTDMGKFIMAAKHHQTIAEIYESEVADLQKAIQHFEQAADYFKGEESTSSANKCMLKVAQFSANLENYEKAIKIYEQVATTSLESTLLKYSAKEYMFRAALCKMCQDAVDARIAIEKYQEMYPAFQDSRECKLLTGLLNHLEEQDVDAYTDAVKQYDSISRLDQWYTMMLLRIKKTISSEDLC